MTAIVRQMSCCSLLAAVLLATLGISAAGAEQTPAQQDFEKGRTYQTGEGVKQDLGMALKYYARALKSDPDFFPALYNTALVYYTQKKYTQAGKVFIKAAKVARNQESREDEALAWNGLGSCYYKEGKVGNAEKKFRGAVQLNSSLVEAHYNLINLLVAEERWEKANEALDSAARSAPSPRYQIFKGRIKGGKSREEGDDIEVKIGLIGLLVGVFLYWVYKKVRTG